MFTIEWEFINSKHYRAERGQFRFEKKIGPTGTVYFIYDKGVLKYNTRVEHMFISKAYGAINHHADWWKL